MSASLIVDAHCHLDSYKTIKMQNGLLPITTGYSHSSNIANVAIAKKYNLPYVLGVAPQTAVKEGISNLELWIAEIKKHSPVAIGEIGLDFHWAKSKDEIKREKILFERMLSLVEEIKLPMVIHSREAETEVINILRERKLKSGIMMHFFSGTLKEAEKAIDLGALISIPPVYSKERKKIINNVALENILVETDSPYVAKNFYEVKCAIQYIAEIKKLDIDIIAEHTAKNAIRLFKLDHLI
ncbi:MAG: TatD family hydrolase [Candidatus Micrarchaeota archaeon]